jgi:asparagine synthase (glutamine-hydrolysing)
LAEPTAAVIYETLLSAVSDADLLLRDRHVALQHPLAARLDQTMPGTGEQASEKMWYDLATYLPDDILVKVDRASMYSSLETRAPFLHHHVVEFAMSLPPAARIMNGRGKRILRELLSRYVPPSLYDRPKRGFAIPVSRWLRAELRPWATALLAADQPGWQYLARDRVTDLWNRHQAGADHGTRLWHSLILMQWFASQEQPL